MQNTLKALFVTVALGIGASACNYAGVAAVGDAAIIARNDNFITFGLLRKVYVCKITPGGLTQCSTAESP